MKTQEILRGKFVFLVVLLVLWTGSVAFCEGPGGWWLVEPELLAAGNLEVVWQNALPLEPVKDRGWIYILGGRYIPAEKLSRLIIVDGRIYALSDRNYAVSMSTETGRVMFSRPLASAGFKVMGFELYENQLYLVIGNRLVEIDPEYGTESSSKRLIHGITCPAARNRWYFYVGGSDKRLHTLRAEDMVQVFEVGADNESGIVSILADDSFVIFGTDAGNVISMTPGQPKRQWQFDAADGIVGQIVREADELFMASKDTNVYKLNARTGELLWKYQAGAVLNMSPRVTRKVVYQYVRSRGLAAVERESGELLWQLEEGIDLLAESGGKAYVFTNAGTLVVMDNKKSERLYSINMAGVSKYATNLVDSRIYIGSESGRIACLKPVE